MTGDGSGLTVKSTGEARFFYGYVIVAAVFLVLLASGVVKSSYGVFLQPLISEFGWSRTVLSGASALNDIAFGILCVVSAKLYERFNPRVIVSVCGVLMGLSFFLLSQMSSSWQLYLYFGVLIALSMSSFIAVLSTVARWFVLRRGLMTAVALSGLCLGSTIASPVANWLIAIYDWRYAYIILGIATAVIMLLAAQFLKRDPYQAGQLPYGMSAVEQHASAGWGLSLSQALRTRQLWLVSGMYFVFLFCNVLVLVHIVIHGIDMGLTPANAANVLAIYGVVSIICIYLMGISGDRFGNRRTFVICFLLLAISFSWLLVAGNVWQFFVFAVILGIAYSGMQVLFSPLVAELFGLKSHGMILGIASVGGAIGAASGPLLAGYIFDQTGSYRIAFIMCIAVSIIAFVLTLLLRPVPRKDIV